MIALPITTHEFVGGLWVAQFVTTTRHEMGFGPTPYEAIVNLLMEIDQ